MTENITIAGIIGIKCLAAILMGVLEGNGAVYVFNRIPPSWLTNYGEKPAPELLDPYTQRVKSHPWKYVLTMLFIVLNIKLVIDDWQFAIPATITIWILLELAIGDIKYRILPDQLIALLFVCGIGFLPYHSGIKECLLGLALGFVIMAAFALLGKLAYKRDTLGGGDIKLFTALGFISGPTGVVLIFIATTLISAGHLVYLLARKKIRTKDTVPMVPYIAISAAAYLVFFWNGGGLWIF